MCGGPIPDDSEEEVGIPAGTLDDDPGIRPQGHVFVEFKAPWFEITDSLPQFQRRGTAHESQNDPNLHRLRKSIQSVVPSQNLKPDVLMMEPAKDWYRGDASDLLGLPKIWRIFLQ